MVAIVSTVAFLGLEARGVEVQVQLAPGLPAFVMVGLPDKAVAESRERVRAALAALLTSAPDERELFDAAFDVFWRDPDWEGKLRALLLPKVKAGMPPPRRGNRLADALAARAPARRVAYSPRPAVPSVASERFALI